MLRNKKNGVATLDRLHVGTQLLYTEKSGSGAVSKTRLVEGYDYTLIDALFTEINIPAGYHAEYLLSYFGQTENDNFINITLNNITTKPLRTWAGTEFISNSTSKFFKKEDIILTDINTTRKGIKLFYEITGPANSTWKFYNIVLNTYLVQNT